MLLIKSLLNPFIHQIIHVIIWCCTILACARNASKWNYFRHGIVVSYWCRRRRTTRRLACQTNGFHLQAILEISSLSAGQPDGLHLKVIIETKQCDAPPLSHPHRFNKISVFVCAAPLISSYILLSWFTIILISHHPHLFIIVNNIVIRISRYSSTHIISLQWKYKFYSFHMALLVFWLWN